MKYTIKRPPLSENFFLPSKEKLLELKVGDIVKIMFQVEDAPVERMWVKITKQQDISEWTGKLDNDPNGEKMKTVLKSGDKIIFSPLDIIQIWDDSQRGAAWKFKESRNVGVYSTQGIARGDESILYVIHDTDGDWQFLPSETPDDKDAIFIHLKHLIRNDNSLLELGDLPMGYYAWRKNINDPWKREELKN